MAKRPPNVEDLVKQAAVDPELSLESAILAGWRIVLLRAATGEMPLSGTALANLIQASGGYKAAGGGEDSLVEMMEYLGCVDDDLMPPETESAPGSTDPSDST